MSAVAPLEDAYFDLRAGRERPVEEVLLLLEAAAFGPDTEATADRAGTAQRLRLRRIAECLRASLPGLSTADRRRFDSVVEGLPSRRFVDPPGYEFTLDWMVGHEDEWRRRLAPLATAPGVRVLEVGCFEGQTTCWLLDNVLGPDATVTCVDRFDDGDPFFGAYRARFHANVERSGRSDAVELVEAGSTIGLASLEHRTFDFVYLDAAHSAVGVLGELALAWPLLPPDGRVVVDDVDDPGFPGVRIAIEAFETCVGPDVDVEVCRGQAWLTRTCTGW